MFKKKAQMAKLFILLKFLLSCFEPRIHLAIDSNRRHRVMKPHSTHLLHAPLQYPWTPCDTSRISEQVESLRLTHALQAVTPEELRAIEQQVNEKIWEAMAVETVETDIDTAKKWELWPSLVRNTVRKFVLWLSVTTQWNFRGGTHVGNTSEIGLFKIVKEEGIGSGTRRILAVTGRKPLKPIANKKTLWSSSSNLEIPQLKEVPHKLKDFKSNSVNCKKENAELKEKAAAAAAGDVFKDVKEDNGHRYIASQVSVSDAGALRTFADNWKQKTTLTCLFLSQQLVTRSTFL